MDWQTLLSVPVSVSHMGLSILVGDMNILLVCLVYKKEDSSLLNLSYQMS